MNLRSFSPYSDYSYPLTLSNVGEPPWSWISRNHSQGSKREIKFRRCLFTSSFNRKIRHLHVVVVQKQERNVQKSVMHVRSCCFAYQTNWFFWSSRCRPRLWIFKSLITRQWRSTLRVIQSLRPYAVEVMSMTKRTIFKLVQIQYYKKQVLKKTGAICYKVKDSK